MLQPASSSSSVDLLMLENRGAVVQLGGHIDVVPSNMQHNAACQHTSH